ncbi:hypothetical protein [Methylibium sp. Pch-M]|uniref:hypothetical protein n=1 Tax=Methylibium sp. Pch-M TaxID=2082386 RepID=UPI00101323C3|nr:hypothetical protein [Methylibium sp. Pch-M]
MTSSIKQTKRARKPSKRAMVSRAGSVTNWGGYVFVYGDRRNNQSVRQSLLSLDIRGEFTSPVRGVSAFALRVTPESEPGLGNVEIPCVGVWIAAKPEFDGGVHLSDREFDLLLAMATAGKLLSVYLHFQEPHYGKALIASVSFSSDPPDEG